VLYGVTTPEETNMSDYWQVTSATGHGSPHFSTDYEGKSETEARRAYKLAIAEMVEVMSYGLIEGQAYVTLTVNDDIEAQKSWT
jgi:hypothetical protein